jgi:hypothetical protein
MTSVLKYVQRTLRAGLLSPLVFLITFSVGLWLEAAVRGGFDNQGIVVPLGNMVMWYATMVLPALLGGLIYGALLVVAAQALPGRTQLLAVILSPAVPAFLLWAHWPDTRILLDAVASTSIATVTYGVACGYWESHPMRPRRGSG